MDILKQIDDKFSDNLSAFLAEGYTCKDIDLKARAIAAIGQVSSRAQDLQPHQREISSIFGEIFSDIIVSVYLTACALDRPAQGVLRRSLELGVAIVYLWDMPHAFWGWKKHDADLNFNDMLEHLSKDAYTTFLSSLKAPYLNNGLFDYNEARRLYRMLSNTIHGKITTHESTLPDRFSHNSDDCKSNLDLIGRVQTLLLQLFRGRFNDYFHDMIRMIPSIITVI